MVEIKKADWKLFRERIGGWQEAYMEKLLKEYAELLMSDKPASTKFWELDERIREDRRTPGVSLMLKKSKVHWDLVALMHDGAITADDLEGFSEELKEYVLLLAGSSFD